MCGGMRGKMVISVVLCEGAHDIAFISKILCANGCEEYKDKVSDYPYPIAEQISNNYAKDVIGEKKIGNGPDSPFVPKAAYTNGEKLILFHNMNGDSDTGSRFELIEQYRKNGIALKMRENPDGITAFEFYLFYDADDMGVAGRLEWIGNEFSEQYRLDTGKPVQAGKSQIPAVQETGGTVGTYIFHNPSDPEQKGTLEDQLLLLMRRENGELFDRAMEFLHANELPPERTKEYDSMRDGYGKGKNYKPKKSQISAAGQLQFSGMSNSVIILKSDYIRKQTILQDEECAKIAGLILGE